MQQDELMLKLTVDQSQVAPALNQFKQNVDSAATGGQKSFIKVGSEAKAFKKMIEELTAQSPLLGQALKLAINPVVGIITGAILAFKKLTEMQEEVIKKANEFAKASAAEQVAAIDAANAKNPQQARVAGALANAKTGASKSIGDYLEEAKKQLIKERGDPYAGMQGPGAVQFVRQIEDSEVMERAKQLREAAVNRYVALQESTRRIESDEADRALDAENEKRLQKKKQKADEDWATAANKWAEAAFKAADEMDKNAKHRKEEADKQKAAAAKAAEKASGMATDYMSQYMPSLSEMAAQGGWSFSHKYHRWNWNATPLAQQAQYIQSLEQGARNQFLSGDAAGARETIFGKGGVRELKQQLVDAGLLKPDAADMLQAVTDGRGALKVNIVAAEGAE